MNKPLLGFLDIGARGQPILPPSPLRKLVKYFAIDADCDSVTQLSFESDSWGFCDAVIIEAAISDTISTSILKLLRNPYASSFIEVSRQFMSRYGNPGYDEVARISLNTTTIDTLLKSGTLDNEIPYLLKVDVQGADLNVLKGSEHFLKEHCVACMIELDFIGAYEVGPTGFKIGSFLEEFGFVLVGNYNTQYRSSARLCPSRHAYSERLFWSDAIFVKDELVFRNSANTDTLAGSQLALGQGLVIAASYLGFHDYALETLDQLPPSPINTAL
jgi:FkbM family methyltransferase